MMGRMPHPSHPESARELHTEQNNREVAEAVVAVAEVFQEIDDCPLESDFLYAPAKGPTLQPEVGASDQATARRLVLHYLVHEKGYPSREAGNMLGYSGNVRTHLDEADRHIRRYGYDRHYTAMRQRLDG